MSFFSTIRSKPSFPAPFRTGLSIVTASEVEETPCVPAVFVSGAVTCRCPASMSPPVFCVLCRAFASLQNFAHRAVHLPPSVLRVRTVEFSLPLIWPLLPCAGRCNCIVLLLAVWGLAVSSFMINDKFYSLQTRGLVRVLGKSSRTKPGELEL